MLPTPSTSHVDPNRIYEPAEDSYLLLDTLSSATETQFLKHRFSQLEPHSKEAPTPSPLLLEVGSGSGVVLAFLTANAQEIFGRPDILALGTDVNQFACQATKKTVLQACNDYRENLASGSDGKPSEVAGLLLATLGADLASPMRDGVIDVLIFNPPYVPSANVPDIRDHILDPKFVLDDIKSPTGSFEHDSRLLAMAYEGGVDGMEVTSRLLEQLPSVMNVERGVAYILLCQQNKPEKVMQRIRDWSGRWAVEIVGRSGKMAGWEKLSIIRIWKT